ncbi:MAG: cardiolipin synthase [Desulfosporosinus sp.]
MKPTHVIKAYRILLFGTAIVVQLLLMITFIIWFRQYFVGFYGASILISIIAVLWILNTNTNPAYQIGWVIAIMVFPIFGALLFVYYRTGRFTKKRMGSITRNTIDAFSSMDGILDSIAKQDVYAGNQSRFIQNASYYPPYLNSGAEYLPSGECKFARLKEELKKAEHFIFLEYFIIEEGLMWNSILEILQAKAASGVDVRVIYDDLGCLPTLPHNYNRKLEDMGIKCCVFNPLIPVLTSRLNNRDHRKIAIIDGHTGFTGGINLADEYINKVEKYGHWKDAAILIKGQAVWSLTVMFLSVWNNLREVTEDNALFYNPKASDLPNESDGYVQPFGDSPLDDVSIAEGVYLNLINKAKKYIYITTPYLIINHEMITALCLAAKGGVDVRIITPYHADKWYVHTVSRSYYHALVKGGVKVYEYMPGFIHSKNFVVDDEYGVVGTINMDYRSLYLHFECAVWLYRCSCIRDILKDFQATMQVCREITMEDLNKIPQHKVLVMSILRVFAPLM